MFGIMNEVEVVDNTEVAINASILARNQNNWSLAQLIDKPDSQQVYLVFAKACGYTATNT